MNRRITFLLVVLSFFSIQTAFSQTYNETIKTQKKALKLIASELKNDHDKKYKKATLLAKEKGWELFRVDKKGTIIALQGIDERGLPMYLITTNNIRSAATISTDKLWPGGSTGLSLSGSKSALKDKLALWDGAIARLTHREFQSRVKVGDNGSGTQDHSTHVAGTMIAAGINSVAKGMAFKAPSLISFDFDNDDAEMAEAATKYNLLVSNHSYGNIAGWRYNDSRAGTATDPNWEWWGEEGKFEDYKFGIYNSSVAAWDQIAFNAPYYLIVKSAGNNQDQNGPAIGSPYYQRNSAGVFTLHPQRVANAISSNNSYDNLSTNCNAKNSMVVGAVSALANGYTRASDVILGSFSSWGPTDDGRIKPDVVANGVNVLSTFSGSDDAYGTLSGTSMAAPSVSGSALLLQEHYSNRNNGNYMRSATLKGLIIHTADEAGIAPGPDYKFGWGLMNTATAAKVISENGTYSQISERTLNQNETYEFKVTASGREPLSITISWTDPAATATPDGTVDSPNLKLINDLDIRITKNNETFSPWVLNPAIPGDAATRGDNFRDNVEKIILDNTEPGEIYTVKVTHKGVLKNGSQPYSIIATGIGGSNYCASSATTTSGLKISEVKIGTLVSSSTDCAGYSNFLKNAIAAEPNKALPLSITLGNCTTSANGYIKVYIDWNGNGSFTDANETISVSPLLNASSVYNTQIQIPSTVNKDDILRMRIIVQETNQSDLITPCGTYNNGETEDYSLKINAPSNDVGVTGLTSPENTSCGNSTQKVAIKVKNYGTVAQNSIPVKVDIISGGTIIKTLNGTLTQTLQTGQEGIFTFVDSFSTTPGASYTFNCSTNLAADQISSNNNFSTSVSIATNPDAPQISATYCDEDQILLKSNTTDGTVFWFDSENATIPIAVGNNTSAFTPITKVYGALNDFKGKLGPSSKTEFESGANAYNQFTPSVSLTTYAPIVLDRARLYIGNSGTVTFSVTNEETGEEVSSVTINASATRFPEAAGSQDNDPNDTGKVYDLGLKIPSPGNYLINISYGDGATIFRNKSANTLNYPFVIPNVISITGNTASISNNTGPLNYWYYFYDLEVSALGCKSPRTSVDVQKTTITLNNNILYSSSVSSNQWYLNDIAIPGATEPTYKPLHSGVYTVKLTDACAATSNEIDYKLPVIPENIGLKLYPVPSTDKISVEFNVWEPKKVKLSVINSLGQYFVDETVENFSGILTRDYLLYGYSSGMYFLRVIIGKEVYTGQFSVIK
ncbi:S8 family serine peptidase [Solitalea canadensis]|uniref:Subtilisin-like serine protease n=1 Tax=Solitalea canadensis (strain ATCC 29591 / DSM 3403 / JCM 21819 / LMG 8368 / NBRC 15130 / NCIMB 12057 / USAM 9D) TaxID=929556 RepID=H8KNP2_SOLCM|nr:S8 family serine peptidase [Solitalea canadensis]AFD08175.1 subtilisin-like serine protease [Solitalea canadensis DSM 3403]